VLASTRQITGARKTMRFCRPNLVVCFVVTCFAAPAQGAAAVECRSPDDAGSFEVEVHIDAGETQISNNLSKAQLSGALSHGRRRNILGVMQGNVDLSWHINYKIEEYRDGVCFWVTSVDVQLAYRQLDVHIASEYEPGSCQYEAILDHEKEHVTVARRIMSPYAQQIRASLTTLSIPTPDLPSVADSPEEARAQVNEVFRRQLMPVRKRMFLVLRARQAEVDTRENYGRTFRQCRRW